MRLQHKQSDAGGIQALHREGQGEEKSGRWFMSVNQRGRRLHRHEIFYIVVRDDDE